MSSQENTYCVSMEDAKETCLVLPHFAIAWSCSSQGALVQYCTCAPAVLQVGGQLYTIPWLTPFGTSDVLANREPAVWEATVCSNNSGASDLILL